MTAAPRHFRIATTAFMLSGLTGVLAPTTVQAAGCERLTQIESGATPENAICRTYLTAEGTVGTSCHWPFAYRSGEAVTFADTLWQQISSCREGELEGQENSVNHPDSYALRTWAAASGVYRVSVKDKAQLNGTYVFLRTEPGK